MITDPVNDQGCLGQLLDHTRLMADLSMAKALAWAFMKLPGEYGGIPAVVLWLKMLPQRDDFGGSDGEDAIRCDVRQRLRTFPDDPNCFERTAMFIAVAEHISPSTRWTAGTMDTAYGRHTVPVAIP